MILTSKNQSNSRIFDYLNIIKFEFLEIYRRGFIFIALVIASLTVLGLFFIPFEFKTRFISGILLEPFLVNTFFFSAITTTSNFNENRYDYYRLANKSIFEVLFIRSIPFIFLGLMESIFIFALGYFPSSSNEGFSMMTWELILTFLIITAFLLGGFFVVIGYLLAFRFKLYDKMLFPLILVLVIFSINLIDLMGMGSTPLFFLFPSHPWMFFINDLANNPENGINVLILIYAFFGSIVWLVIALVCLKHVIHDNLSQNNQIKKSFNIQKKKTLVFPKKITHLHVIFRSFLTDPIYLILYTAPLLIALLYPSIIKIMSQFIEEFGMDFNLDAIQPLIISLLFLSLTPAFMGFITGMILVDERESKQLYGLFITPVSFWKYLLIRISIPSLIGIGLTILSLYIIDPNICIRNPISLVLSILLFSMETPFWALLFVTLAKDKIQGITIMKSMNILSIIPLIGFFLPIQWSFFCAICPPFWPLMIYWHGDQEIWFLLLLFMGGLIYHWIIIIYLKRKMVQKIFQS
jgi:hypothetical protein